MKVKHIKNRKHALTYLSCIAVVGATLLTACSEPSFQQNSDGSVESVEPSESSKLARLENQTIVLHGSFQEQIKDGLFVIEDDSGKDLDNVLVLNESGRSFAVPADSETPIWVVGEVRPLVQDLGEPVETVEGISYDSQFAIYADRITLAPSPEELVENPEVFYDQEVTVYGEIEQVEAENTFILRSPGLFSSDGIIVIGSGTIDIAAVEDGTKAAASGILRPYVIAELEKDYALSWDLSVQQRLEADYRSTPVLITDLISVVEE